MKDRWMTKVYFIVSCCSRNRHVAALIWTHTQFFLIKTDNLRGSPQLDSKFWGWDYDMHADITKWIKTGQWEKRGEKKAKSPNYSFHWLSSHACTPAIKQLQLVQEEFFLCYKASTLCLVLCLLELISHCFLDLHVTDSQKDVTDSFHTNHRKKSELTGCLPEGTVVSHFYLIFSNASNCLFLVLKFTTICKAPFPWGLVNSLHCLH